MVSSIRAQFIHQPLGPDKAAVSPNSQQLVRRWSVKSAPALRIHIPHINWFIRCRFRPFITPCPPPSLSSGPCCRAEGRFGRQPPPLSRRRVLTSLRFLWLGRSAVYPSSHERPETHTHCGCATPAAGQMNITWTFYEGFSIWCCDWVVWPWGGGVSQEMSGVRAPPGGVIQLNMSLNCVNLPPL